MKRFDVNSAEEFERIIGDRMQNARNRQFNAEKCVKDDPLHAKHLEVANLMVKVINVIRMDPMIKKVMSLRIIGPLRTGKERSRMSIAIELGLRESEVAEIESAGIEILDHYLRKYSSEEFVAKFNQDRKLENEVKTIQTEMGKSEQSDVQKESA